MNSRLRPAPWLELSVIRQKDGHSQSSLAKAAGYSKSYISELEAGHRRPNAGVIKRLADTLKVPLSVLEPSPRQETAA